MRIINIGETDSTNRYLRDYIQPDGEEMTVVAASYQSAGRGQGANSWESEPGCNLLFSILLREVPLEPRRQFLLSMADALAQRDAMGAYADDITLKWPNDLYWRNRKLGGTLIETSLTGGSMRRCIIGTGININQRRFLGDAPNPVSLADILGHETDIQEVLGGMLDAFGKYYGMLCAGEYDEITRLYHEAMYRRTGMYAYEDSGGRFMAETDHVEQDGTLVLCRDDGTTARYAFKEVRFVIQP